MAALTVPINAADPSVVVWLVFAIGGTLVLILYMGIRLFAAIGRVRGESRRADETARTLQREWEEYNEGQSEMIRRKLAEIEERADRLEKNTAGRIGEFEELVGRTRKEIERLEKYLRDVFEVELKNAFDSFDSTVSGVLGEMKSELLRGVDRIEEIETLMGNRNALESHFADSHEAVQSLTSGDLEPERPLVSDDALEVDPATTDASSDLFGEDGDTDEDDDKTEE